jgi:hypothetical protein
VFLVGRETFRSQRAVEKIGGVLAGSRPDATGRDRFLYEITASDFASNSSVHQLPTETKERDQSILLKNISTKSADFTYFPRIILRKIFS